MTTTLHNIRTAAADHVASDVASGNLDPRDADAVETYCHESADGHHDVIYTYAVRELFANGDLDEYLDEVELDGDVDQYLTAAAYYAVRDAYAQAVRDYVEVWEVS